MQKTVILSLLLALTTSTWASNATVRLDSQVKHQHITGFGGFVCSPQFTYNHMSNDEIKKVWGKTSTVGCNIMRLYIPIGKNAWGQSLATAKLAKQMGLIVFASPWGQPAEWKTNGTSNAKNSDGTLGYLKKENWADYAQYLEDYIQYMRKNGVELDAISIQNEPDWQATYAGCMWSATDIASFVKTYGRKISCKIMAPETLSVNDNYVNALNKSDVIDCFDIYGGHQYGGIQSAYKNLAKKGKEIWMTEYLINWNEVEGNTRNFDFTKDFFNFFRAINTCMLGDFNAWIHYAAKRYYGMMGDGQRGAGSSGTITKRGYIMAHFAKFATGMTRIEGTFGGGLEGSAYLSQTGDTVVAVMANATANTVETTFDLPFYTLQGELRTTVKSKNFTLTKLAPEAETCRPVATIAAQSVATVLFVKSRDRQSSNMNGTATRFDRLDDMATTKTGFGTAYKLSGKTKTFDSSNPLISSRKTLSSGYIALNDRYSQLVMHVKKVTSTSSLTAGKPTLYYVNAKGEVNNHEYERLDLSQGENFDMVFDLSPATLEDGCIGLLSLTCDNTQSHLSIKFGDVCFGSNYAGKLSGDYVADDSNVLDFTADHACTSIDLTDVNGCPSTFPWLQGTNRVVWLPDYSSVGGANLIHGDLCHHLELSADGGPFRPAKAFQAQEATFTCTVDGIRLMMLPFTAIASEGAHVYIIGDDLSLTEMRSAPAHKPVLVMARGEVTFTGSGEVSYATCPLSDKLRGTYTEAPLYAGDYVLAQQDGVWGLQRLTAPATLPPFGVYATLDSTEAFIPFEPTITGVQTVRQHAAQDQWFDLQGRSVSMPSHKGIHILRSADGQSRKVIR
ncbi:MAG: hypothetical protein IKR31_00455 [Prevotella sp.]|nr:hypothetical protein [Prevotella sp.]